jgi:hypothetical protein
VHHWAGGGANGWLGKQRAQGNEAVEARVLDQIKQALADWRDESAVD